MKVLILTEGGERIGFGHVTRCISLCQAFEESGMTPKLIINADESVKYLLKDCGDFQISDWLAEADTLKTSVSGADIVIIDSYLADLPLYNQLSGLAGLPVYLDDFNRLNYPRGVVVNGSINAAAIKYPKNAGLTFLLGAGYAPLRREFWDVPEKKINEHPGSLLMIFGNNKSAEMIPDFLDVLSKRFPNLTKNIVSGKESKNLKIPENSGKANFFYDADAGTMKQLMMDADIAFSAGGQVLNELARVGVPTLAMAVAENQLNNIKGWQESGFLEFIGWWRDDKVFQKFSEKLGSLESKEERLKRGRIGKSNIDGQGARRVVAALLGSNK